MDAAKVIYKAKSNFIQILKKWYLIETNPNFIFSIHINLNFRFSQFTRKSVPFLNPPQKNTIP